MCFSLPPAILFFRKKEKEMSYLTALPTLSLLTTALVQANTTLAYGDPNTAGSLPAAAQVVSFTSAPLVVQVIVVLFVLLFGVISLATFFKTGPKAMTPRHSPQSN
jgi:hypothetical protein